MPSYQYPLPDNGAKNHASSGHRPADVAVTHRLATWETCIMNKHYPAVLITILAALLIAGCSGGGVDINVSGTTTSLPSQGYSVHTLQFSNVDFDEIEIMNSFAVVVQYGDHFDIEIEIDSQYRDLVSVSQDGVRLKVQFDPAFQGDIRAQVARGIVTLPLLNELRTSGSAFVDFAGFTQSTLRIRQSGSSHVEGSNGRIDFIDANLSGSSNLQLTNVLPAAASNVELSGSSHVALYMMDGATITGSASGSANVGYFGNDVSVLVSTSNAATVTWLGSDAN